PPVAGTLADESRGLVLVTGPTGSGKTTTLAAMIQHINLSRAVHIVTIEDPIEVLHHDEQASINQREIGQDTGTFLAALRDAMRQDPDVILIGEMRDPETVQAALQAAETGHLVLSTLHTVDVIADGGYYGVMTFDQSLLELTLSGRVSLENALEAATNKHDFQLMVDQKQGPRVPVDV